MDEYRTADGRADGIQQRRYIAALYGFTDPKVVPLKLPGGRLRWFVGGEEQMAFDLPGDKVATATLDLSDLKDSMGRPATVASPWEFATSTPNVVTVAKTGDLTASVTPVGPHDAEGAFEVSATADADFGVGVRPYVISASGTVTSSGAVIGGSMSFAVNP
jgi:hypothetical protein